MLDPNDINDADWQQEQAERLILSHAEDVEYMTVGEALIDEVPEGTSEEDYERVQRAVHDLCRKAVITVDWDDDEPAAPPLTVFLARYPQAPDALFSSREAARRYCDDQQAYRNRGPAAATWWTSSEHGYDEQHGITGGSTGGVVTVLTVDDHQP